MPQPEPLDLPYCEARKRQAIHIGYVEMERIVEEVHYAEEDLIVTDRDGVEVG